MQWSDIVTRVQQEKLTDETIAAIKKLQKTAVRKGLLSYLKIGATPVVLGSYSDCHELYLLPNGGLEHRLSVRDGLAEEWVNQNPPPPNDKKLRELIPLCQITPDTIQTLIHKLSA